MSEFAASYHVYALWDRPDGYCMCRHWVFGNPREANARLSWARDKFHPSGAIDLSFHGPMEIIRQNGVVYTKNMAMEEPVASREITAEFSELIRETLGANPGPIAHAFKTMKPEEEIL